MSLLERPHTDGKGGEDPQRHARGSISQKMIGFMAVLAAAILVGGGPKLGSWTRPRRASVSADNSAWLNLIRDHIPTAISN